MDYEGFEVNLKLKEGKGNDDFYKTNNNKGNETDCFPFSLLITPNQTAPYSKLNMT